MSHRIPLSQMYKIIDLGYKTDCWIWIKGKSGSYGCIRVEGKVYRSHIYFYIKYKGKYDDNLILDHLCRNTLCVNPDHLEPVTSIINTMRGFSPPAENARKTHCAKGHEFTDENTYKYPSGKRACKICRKDSMNKFLYNKIRIISDNKSIYITKHEEN